MSLRIPYQYIEHPSMKVPDGPVLVMLHGYGSHEEDLFSMRHALFPGFHILSLRAPHELPWGGYAWFPIDFTPHGVRINPQEAAATLTGLTAAIEEIGKTFRRPVVMMGFSQGTIMSFGVALSQPSLIRGVIGFSGRLVTAAIPEKPSPDYAHVRIIQTHGSMDPVIPVSEGRSASETLKRLGFAHEYREYTFQHEISMNCLDDVNHWIAVNFNHFTKPE